jgi:hypothetical protein
MASSVIVVYGKPFAFRFSANHALVKFTGCLCANFVFDAFGKQIAPFVVVAALSAPRIKSVFFVLVRRKKLSRSRFFRFASSAS